MLKWIDDPEEVTTVSVGLGPDPDELLITALTGLVHGTLLRTEDGWVAVEDIYVGDKVLTFDNGMQTVVDVQRERSDGAWHHATARPVFVPEGALDNDAEIWLMPDQGVLWETAEEEAADPFVVLPANCLSKRRGISRRMPDRFDGVTTLTFANDEVVQVQGGAWLHCPHPRPVFDFNGSEQETYRRLRGAEAKALLDAQRMN